MLLIFEVYLLPISTSCDARRRNLMLPTLAAFLLLDYRMLLFTSTACFLLRPPPCCCLLPPLVLGHSRYFLVFAALDCC